MDVAWSMHEEASLLDGISNVWAREGEVLESSGDATIVGRVREQSTIMRGQFRAGVNRGGYGFAGEHIGVREKLEGVLLLAKEETGWGWW